MELRQQLIKEIETMPESTLSVIGFAIKEISALSSAENARLQGIEGYSINEFEKNMQAAISKGAANGN